MKCRSCSADIDAKAIVCYRCGTPTADPVALKPRVARGSRPSWRWMAVIALAALAVAAYMYFWQVRG